MKKFFSFLVLATVSIVHAMDRDEVKKRGAKRKVGEGVATLLSIVSKRNRHNSSEQYPAASEKAAVTSTILEEPEYISLK